MTSDEGKIVATLEELLVRPGPLGVKLKVEHDLASKDSQNLTNPVPKASAGRASDEVDIAHQNRQHLEYGDSHIGATAKDIAYVVTDAASGVVDVLDGLEEDVADSWRQFRDDGKAEGVGE